MFAYTDINSFLKNRHICMSVYICMLVCQWIYINACISVDTISGHIYKKLNLGVHLWRRHLDKNKHCSISLERRNGRLSTLQMKAHTGCQGVTSTKVFSRESKRLFFCWNVANKPSVRLLLFPRHLKPKGVLLVLISTTLRRPLPDQHTGRRKRFCWLLPFSRTYKSEPS